MPKTDHGLFSITGLMRAFPRAGFSRIMQGQPHRGPGRVGPFYPVAAMGRDEEVVARPQHPVRSTFEAQAGAAPEEQHPLVGLLIIPFPRRSRLAPGHDALQPKIMRFQQDLKDFRRNFGWNGIEKIIHVKTFLGR